MRADQTTSIPATDYSGSELQDTCVVYSTPAEPALTTPLNAWILRQSLRLEYNTFLDSGYVESFAELGEEYAPYLSDSTFLSVVRDDKVVGTARILDWSESSFKTLNDIESDRLKSFDPHPVEDPEHTFEVGTLSVEPAYRHTDVAILLYGAMLAKSRVEEKPSLLASFDDDANGYLRSFETLFPSGVSRLGPPVDYLGSPTTPVLIDMNEAYRGLASVPEIRALLDSVKVVTDKSLIPSEIDLR